MIPEGSAFMWDLTEYVSCFFLLLSGNASHFLSVSTCAALWWRVRLLFVSVSPESSVPSIISEWLRFVSRVSSPPAFAWLQICWGGGFGDVISVPSPRCHSQPPLGFFSPDVAGCLLHQREETLLPLLMRCPLVVVVVVGGVIFSFVCRPGSSDTAEKHILGAFRSLRLQFVWKC